MSSLAVQPGRDCSRREPTGKDFQCRISDSTDDPAKSFRSAMTAQRRPPRCLRSSRWRSAHLLLLIQAALAMRLVPSWKRCQAVVFDAFRLRRNPLQACSGLGLPHLSRVPPRYHFRSSSAIHGL